MFNPRWDLIRNGEEVIHFFFFNPMLYQCGGYSYVAFAGGFSVTLGGKGAEWNNIINNEEYFTTLFFASATMRKGANYVVEMLSSFSMLLFFFKAYTVPNFKK